MATNTPRWRKWLETIDCPVDDIRFPARDLSQDTEWCEIVIDGRVREIRFHDYSKVYSVPGLYEQLFYEQLRCDSPRRVADLLEDVLDDFEDDLGDFRMLDVGAGNGMVGEELQDRGVPVLVGIDIIKEAHRAADRDRPEVYDEYFVADLTDLSEAVEERLRKMNLNALSCVAALGFGDIPSKAFLKALDVIETPGWLAFNIKEDFLREADATGFSRLISELSRTEVIQIQAYRRYQHRVSTNGKPLHYVAMVARTQKDVPDELMEG